MVSAIEEVNRFDVKNVNRIMRRDNAANLVRQQDSDKMPSARPLVYPNATALMQTPYVFAYAGH